MKIVLDLAGFRRLGSHTGKGGAFLVILTPRSFPNTWHIIVIFTAAMLCCPNCYCCRRVDNSRRFRRCRIHDYIITEGFPPPPFFSRVVAPVRRSMLHTNNYTLLSTSKQKRFLQPLVIDTSTRYHDFFWRRDAILPYI